MKDNDNLQKEMQQSVMTRNIHDKFRESTFNRFYNPLYDQPNNIHYTTRNINETPQYKPHQFKGSGFYRNNNEEIDKQIQNYDDILTYIKILTVFNIGIFILVMLMFFRY